MWTQSRTPDAIHYSLAVSELDQQVVLILWQKVLGTLTAQHKPWDYLRVEVWDEGQIVVFPALTTASGRIDEVSWELNVEGLRDEQYEIDELPDDEADAADAKLAQRIAAALLSGGRGVLAGRGMKIRVHRCGDEPALATYEA